MYQSVGHHAIDLYAEAIGLPLYRREIQGSSLSTDRDYLPTALDEVEDLYELLKTVKVPVFVHMMLKTQKMSCAFFYLFLVQTHCIPR